MLMKSSFEPDFHLLCPPTLCPREILLTNQIGHISSVSVNHILFHFHLNKICFCFVFFKSGLHKLYEHVLLAVLTVQLIFSPWYVWRTVPDLILTYQLFMKCINAYIHDINISVCELGFLF